MKRFIQFEYNEKALPPIDDYENDEALSLDTVLKPILSYFDQLDQFIKKAKEFHYHPSEHGLTEDESAAVYLYTDDCNGQSLHYVLNQALQSEDRAMIKSWLGFLKLFNGALEKLPTVKDTIWRGLPNDIAKQLKENEEVVCWGVTSCSTSADIINSIVDQNSILCSIESLNGKNIHKYTPFANDYEVLLLPGTRLRVKSNELNHGTDKPVIYLEEISDVSKEQLSSIDVTMTSVDESANEEDIQDNDHLSMKSTTSTNSGNNEFHSDDDELKENEIKAVITFSNGARYKLTYRKGRKQGYGIYYSVDGEKFEGQDADDKADGEGICAFENGDRFIGTFRRGIRQGHGILYDVDGLIQAGDWAHDKPTNQSLKIMSDGGHYDWKDATGEEHWYGAYLDGKGNKYIGNVNDDKAHGLGIRIWHDGSRYEGNFEDDKKHGYGIYYYSDRNKYVGQWDNDEMNGQGKLQWASGTNYKGQFTNGKRHGQGKLTFTNQKIQEGNWQNDEYIG